MALTKYHLFMETFDESIFIGEFGSSSEASMHWSSEGYKGSYKIVCVKDGKNVTAWRAAI